MTRPRFTLPLVALVALGLSLGLSACGEPEEPSGATTATTATEEEPLVEIPRLDGRSTELSFDAGFLDTLAALELRPGVVGEAGLGSDGGEASFPITGGSATYYDPAGAVRPYVHGSIRHRGSGLTLSSEGTRVELGDFAIDPGESVLSGTVTANEKVVADDATLFDLDGSTLEPLTVDQGAGVAILAGTTVRLSSDAAAALNQSFGTTAFEAGLVVGTSEITLSPLGG